MSRPRPRACLAALSLAVAACAGDSPLAPAPAPSLAPSRNAATTAIARPTGASAATVFAYTGAVPSVATVNAAGGVWAKYEADFARYAESHWAANGANDATANFYDRAMIYYVWWARTGNAAYLQRAHQLAVNHRAFLQSRGYRAHPYEVMIDGVALHALITGDTLSRHAVGRVADHIAGPAAWSPTLGSTGVYTAILADTNNWNLDARTQARTLTVAMAAWYTGARAPSGVDWAQQMPILLSRVLQSQSPDGAFRYIGTCRYSKPFMSGMLVDALVRYHTTFAADARIPGAVRRAVDYLWARDWVPAVRQFLYIEGACNGENARPTADLNNMIVTGFGFTARQTGDASYRTRGDEVFAGAVNGAWLPGSKQFNQQYTSSYRYLGYRF